MTAASTDGDDDTGEHSLHVTGPNGERVAVTITALTGDGAWLADSVAEAVREVDRHA